MKILLVNIDKGWGGGQEHLRSLAAELKSAGCAPHFLCREGSPSSRAFASSGFPIWPLWGGGAGALRSLCRTAALLRKERFDIVMVTREHDLVRTVLADKLAFPFGRRGKLVACYHTATARRQLFIGAVDGVVCISTFVRERLRAGNRRIAPPVTILYNGISVADGPGPDKFSLQRQRRFFTGLGFPLIGMVGAFFKNQLELVEMMPRLKREFPQLMVALVGDDSDPGLTVPLVEKVRELGLVDSVIFTGKIPHERLADAYFDFDLTVSTFRREGFGLVHLESLAAGTPVVVYDEGGQVDIFRGTSAGVVVEGGAAEFAEAVAALLRNHDARFAMGREGVRLVNATFSVAAMGRRYLEFFSALTGTAQGNPTRADMP